VSIKALISKFVYSKALAPSDLETYTLFDGAIEFTKVDGNVIIRINNPVHLLIDGTLELTTNGEFSVLTNGAIHLDGKQVHLLSRQGKQLRDMHKCLREETLDEIGRIDPEEQQRKYIEFKNQLKEEIKQELIDEQPRKEER
jgi:hypothetical protein